MAEYRLTPAAVRDLENIWQYTAATWGLEQAERYMDDLTAACADLAQSPRSAPACDDIRPGYRRWGVGRHVLYFREAPYGISVVRILHGRMDAPRHLT